MTIILLLIIARNPFISLVKQVGQNYMVLFLNGCVCNLLLSTFLTHFFNSHSLMCNELNNCPTVFKLQDAMSARCCTSLNIKQTLQTLPKHYRIMISFEYQKSHGWAANHTIRRKW